MIEVLSCAFLGTIASPCPALIFLRQVNFWHQLGGFWQPGWGEGSCDYWEMKAHISFSFPLDSSGCPTLVVPPVTPKVGRLGRRSTILLLGPLQCREHLSHNYGEDSCSWGTQRSKTFRFFMTQPQTSLSQWKMFMQKPLNDYVCTGTTSVRAIIHFHSELVVRLMTCNYYPPGQHWDFFPTSLQRVRSKSAFRD